MYNKKARNPFKMLRKPIKPTKKPNSRTFLSAEEKIYIDEDTDKDFLVKAANTVQDHLVNNGIDVNFEGAAMKMVAKGQSVPVFKINDRWVTAEQLGLS